MNLALNVKWKLFLKKKEEKTNHVLLAQKMMSLKFVCSRDIRLLSVLFFAPVFLAVSGSRSGREHRSSGYAFTGRKHCVPPWGSLS